MTVYYSKIGTLRFKDKTLTLKIDLRARIITLKRVTCPTDGCISNVTENQIARTYALRGGRVPQDTLKHCPNCNRDLIKTTVPAYKLYANVDRRINMKELWNGPCQLQYTDETAIFHPPIHVGLRFREAQEFFHHQLFRGTHKEWYHIIHSYNELKFIATTLHVIPFAERGTKKKKQNYTATYAAVPFPPQERFDTEFNDGLARKLGRLI
jgi:hypothetical protein